ncbi:MAG: peptidoglycan DD-metalloendopeptidase family protein [Bacteroidia bacterium]|nr:peptidoglycan DD-metalloendopeptidase family protein [Bacteroidia bacterium]
MHLRPALVLLLITGLFIGIPAMMTAQTDTLPPQPADTLEEEHDEEEPIIPVTYNELLARLVPAYDIYQSWDTVNIHPYKFDMGKNPDSLKLCLRYAACDYCHPFNGKVTSGFGYRRRGYHFGVDIDLNTGDTVRAAFEGRVRISKKSKTYGYVVIIRHNNGLETTYAHLSKLKVRADQYVQAGEMIGLGGNTGRSYGAHLHFEVRYKGYPIDPNELIDFQKQEVIRDSLLIQKKLFKPVADAKSAKYHTIKKGDTLSKIAKRYGTSVKSLCKLNGISTKTILRPGRRLRVR